MRTGPDRTRHAVGFEVIGLLLCVPLASSVTGASYTHMGRLGIALSVSATAWNYAYNVWVDRLMLTFLGRMEKTYMERIAHAICFEMGLLLFSLPLIAYSMSIGLLEAFVIDMGLVVFYVVYAFFYNLAYDRLFPIQPARCPQEAIAAK